MAGTSAAPPYEQQNIPQPNSPPRPPAPAPQPTPSEMPDHVPFWSAGAQLPLFHSPTDKTLNQKPNLRLEAQFFINFTSAESTYFPDASSLRYLRVLSVSALCFVLSSLLRKPTIKN